MSIRFGMKVLAVLGAVTTLAACASYPAEPRYSIRADGAAPAPARTTASANPASAFRPIPTGDVRSATNPADEALPTRSASVAPIEGGALSAPVNAGPRPYAASTPAAGPASEGFSAPPPPRAGTTAVEARASYEIQPGDTISGIGRRFQTPVQHLIDLNGLGPRAAITPGQRLILPTSALDIGGDPYATGPSPRGVEVADAGAPPPPPPPPPSGNAALPPPPREPAATAGPTAAADASTVALEWPVRGDIVRRFGPVGMGERNNGVNIAAAQGTEVRASAAGRVGYVGDDLAGQGLTVLIVHRDGWRTVYGHLGSALVRDGDEITAGQQIGTVGNTAGDGRPSVHFETWRMRGDQPNAIDPLTVLPR